MALMNWTLIILALVLGVNLWLVWKITHPVEQDEEDEKPTEGMILLQNQMHKLTTSVNENIRDIVKEVTRVSETGRQMIGFTDQLKNLQDILKNPKQRGILGEYYLETLLKNVLPPGSYQMQYKFPNDEIVDAVIFVKDRIVPIDSKFSLENYNRLVEEKDPNERARLEKVFENDLKLRIIETSKYIRPQDKTMDFAFMFIPHEAIYYDLVSGTVGAEEENLIQRAASKYRVIAISPTSLFAYLQTVLEGLKGMQIEESIKEIIKNVDGLQKHLAAYEEYYTKVGNALGTAVNQYNLAGKEFKKVDKDILKISGKSLEIDALTLDKPSVE